MQDNAALLKIRHETLQPANNWQKPTPEEVRELIKMTGLTGAQVADLLGLTPQGNKSGGGSRTVRRWTAGDVPIPYAAWAILAHFAGLGHIWVTDGK